MNAPQQVTPTVAQIFHFSPWPSLNRGEKRPSLSRPGAAHPLVLFFYADEHWIRAVRKLKRISPRNAFSLKFRQSTNRVHQAQKLLLDCVHLIYSVTVPEEVRADRSYRLQLPTEDRRELEEGFSENILFAAQALTRGFRIRGIEPFTVQLQASARHLCAAMDALRFVFRSSALCFHSVETSRLMDRVMPVLRDFDVAWTEFEHAISYCYVTMQNVHRQPITRRMLQGPLRFPRDSQLQSASNELMLVLFSETVLKATDADRLLFTMEDVHSYEPYLMFAIPRLAILNGLVYWPEYLPLHATSGEFVHPWFKEDVGKLKLYAEQLKALNKEDLYTLERQLISTLRDDDTENPETMACSSGDSLFTLRQNICSLADSKHSGPFAKDLNTMLGQLFKLYAIQDDATVPNQTRRNTLKRSDLLLLQQPIWRRVWDAGR